MVFLPDLKPLWSGLKLILSKNHVRRFKSILSINLQSTLVRAIGLYEDGLVLSWSFLGTGIRIEWFHCVGNSFVDHALLKIFNSTFLAGKDRAEIMGKLMPSSPGVESFDFLIASSSSLNLNSSSISLFFFRTVI